MGRRRELGGSWNIIERKEEMLKKLVPDDRKGENGGGQKRLSDKKKG